MSEVDPDRRPALAKHVRLRMDPLTGEPVLLYPEGLVELNATAHEVLIRCDGNMSLTAIIEALAAEYEAPADELRGDVLDCVAQLHARNLVVFAP
jgi:pyrroloquinoline quinone biosynthesis protein D